MTLHLPALLALLGTALLTIAIFAPKRLPAMAPAAAPPPFATHVERFAPAALPSAHDDPFARDGAFISVADASLDESVAERSPSWPARVDPRATDCSADARIDLAAALAELRTPWADAILRHALDDESDARVLTALRASGIG